MAERTTTLTLGPRGVERPNDRGSTLLGVLDGATPAVVDQAGAVQPQGPGPVWCLDWWVGAEDRWYLPAREPTVRQRRLGPGPVIETSVRVPGGDVRHRAYATLAGAEPVTVVEVENDTPTPVVLALAVRPYPVGPDRGDGGAGPAPESIGLDPTRHRILIDGEPAVILPRPPNDSGGTAGADLVEVVTASLTDAALALAWDGGDEGGTVTGLGANAVVVYPLPHRTSLRFLVLGSESAPTSARPSASMGVDDVPDAEALSRGWTSVVEAGGRVTFPDEGVAGLWSAARSRLLLATPDLAAQAEALAPGAGLVVEALALGGHQREAERVVAAVAASFPTRLGPDASVASAAQMLTGVATAVALGGGVPSPALVEWGAQVTHLVERAGDPDAGAEARWALATVADLAGDSGAAAHLRAEPAPHVGGADLDRVAALGQQATEAGTWLDASGADDLVGAARYVGAVRGLLVDDESDPGRLELLPRFASAWRGGNLEVHRLPTRWGAMSFGIRWHGARPALLWQLDPHPGFPGTGAPRPSAGPVLACTSLDPDWATTEHQGETLLAGAEQGLDPVPTPGQSFS